MIVTIHGALHFAARHPADKAAVSDSQPLAEGDFSMGWMRYSSLASEL